VDQAISLQIIGAYVTLPPESDLEVERLPDAAGSFSVDMSRVNVAVPQWARDRMQGNGPVPCEETLADMQELGQRPTCKWTDSSQITLLLGDFPTLLPGLSLSLLLPSLSLPICLSSPSFPTPVPIITASSVPSDPNGLSLDCYASYGTSKRSFVCSWEFSNGSSPVQALATTLYHTSPFEVRMTVTNIWGNSASTVRSFLGDFTVEFPFGAEILLSAARPLLLRPEIIGFSVSNPIYTWRSLNSTLQSLCEDAQLICNLTAGSLEPGEWELDVEVRDGKRWGKAHTVLKVRRSIGDLLVEGVDCMVDTGLESYTLDGSNTIDPVTKLPLPLSWSLSPSICTLFPSGSTLTFSPSACLSPDTNYTLTVWVAETELRREYWLLAVRTGLGTVWVRPVGRVAGRGNVELRAGVSGVEVANCSWSQLTSHNFLSYPSFSQLLLPISSLDPGLSYTFQYSCASLSAHLSFSVNSPPSGGVFLISPSTGSPGSTFFSLIAQSWADEDSDYPLTYQYSDRSGQKWSIPSLNPISKTYLAPDPAGNSTLLVNLNICDSLFSCSLSASLVQIHPSLANMNMLLVQKPIGLLQTCHSLALFTAIQREGYRDWTMVQVIQGFDSAINAIMRSLDAGKHEVVDKEGYASAICFAISQAARPEILPFRILLYLVKALTLLPLSAALPDCLSALSALQIAAESRLDIDTWQEITKEPVLDALETLLLGLVVQVKERLIVDGPVVNVTFAGVSVYACSESRAAVSSRREVQLPVRTGNSSYSLSLPATWASTLPAEANIEFILFTSVIPPSPFAPLKVVLSLSGMDIEIQDLSLVVKAEHVGRSYDQYKDGLRTVYPRLYMTTRQWNWAKGRLEANSTPFHPSEPHFVHTIPVHRDYPLHPQMGCFVLGEGKTLQACPVHYNIDLAVANCTCKHFGPTFLQEVQYSGADFSNISRAEIILQHTFNGSVFLVLLVYVFLALIALLLGVLDCYDRPQIEKARDRFGALQGEVIRCLAQQDQVMCFPSPQISSIPALFSLSPQSLPSLLSSPAFPTLTPSVSSSPRLLPNMSSFLRNPSYSTSLRYLYFQHQLGIRQSQVSESENSDQIVTDDLVGGKSIWAKFTEENELLGLVFMRMCSVTRFSRFPIFALTVLGPLYAYSALMFQARRDPNDFGHAIAATKGQFWGGTDTASTVARAILFVVVISGVQKAILWLKPEQWPVTEAKARMPRREGKARKVLKCVQIGVTRVLPWALCVYLFLLCVIIMWNFTLQEMEMVLVNNVVSTAFEFFVCFHCLSGVSLLFKEGYARLKRCLRPKTRQFGVVSPTNKADSISAAHTESFSAKHLVP